MKTLTEDEMAKMIMEMEEYLSRPGTFTTTITRHPPIKMSDHITDVQKK